MALQPQKFFLPFVQGQDTKTDPKQVALGKLLSLQNSTLISPKQIQKRNGNTALSQNIEGGGAISVGTSLAPFKNEIGMNDGTFFYSYAGTDSKWTKKGLYQPVEIASTTITKDKFNHFNQDGVYHSSGLYLYVSSSSYIDASTGLTVPNTATYSIVDSTTGEFIVNSKFIIPNTGTTFSAVPGVVGNFFILLFADAASGHLSYVSIPVSTPLSPAVAVDVGVDLNAAQIFDCCTLGTKLYIAWNNTDGGGGISMKTLDSSLVLSALTDIAGDAATYGMSVFPDTVLNQVWVAYDNGTNLRYLVRSSTLTLVLAFTTLEAAAAANFVSVAGIASNGSASIFWTKLPAADYRNILIRWINPTNTGTGITPANFMLSVGIATRPFSYNSQTYIGVTYVGVNSQSSPPQGTSFVVSTRQIGAVAQIPQVIAKIAPGLSQSLSTKFVPRVSNPSTGNFVFTLVAINEFSTFTAGPTLIFNLFTLGVNSVSINFLSQNGYLNLEYGNNLLTAGGYMQMYDGGALLVEHNFHIYPEIVLGDFTPANVGGSIEDGHVYQYILTYEWMDAYGQVHISNTSVPIPVTVPANGGANTSKVTILAPTLRITAKNLNPTLDRSPVTIGVYRTQKDSPGPFYKLTIEGTIWISTPTTNTVTIVDTFADTSIIAHRQLYTTGGVVSNTAVPATSLVTTYKQRVLALLSELRNTFLFSEQVIPGTPVTFSNLLTWNVDTYGGDVAAWSQMDDKLIIFKPRNIFYMVGDGPSNTGSQNDFIVPQIIPSDVGCSNQRSICLTPIGIIFQSLKGWFLLQRSLSVLYIGADVEFYNGSTVQNTVLVPNTTQVRIFLNGGIILTYDYFLNQWHHGTNLSSVDACLFQNKVTFISTAGLVEQEAVGTFTDNGSFIPMQIQTSWIQVSDLEGFQRMRFMEILGEYRSAHNLVVQIAYDFDSTIAQTVTIPVTSPVTPYQFRVFFAKQKCQAIQITISDSQNGTAGESFALSGLAFNFGVKQGLNKLSAAKSYG